MQSENFDNKIKAAAEQHHPNYDEKAWAKMEKLLDWHLPQKKDRRRFIFFLLVLLFSGGGVWLLINKPWQQSNQTLTTVNTPLKKEGEPLTGSTKEATERSKVGNSSEDKIKDIEATVEPITENSVVANEKKNTAIVENTGMIKQKGNQLLIAVSGKLKADNYKKNKLYPGKDNKAEQFAIDIAGPGITKKDKNPQENKTAVSSPDNSNDKLPKNDPAKIRSDLPARNDLSEHGTVKIKNDILTEQPKSSDKKDIAKKNGSKKNNSFFFSFSAGPDISSIGMDKPGKVKLLTGAGFGYTFRSRWTIRTGFYTGNKVYSADPREYKPSVAPPNSDHLDKIEAVCKVYEIPISLGYNFSRSEKHSLFAGAALSSYIMKKETYDYLYSWPGGQSWVYTWTLKDKNKHYFSVLAFSGGYQRKINNIFSIAAEPYIKLPLAGVGFGKVKLKSAGILFSINISPFQPKAKK